MSNPGPRAALADWTTPKLVELSVNMKQVENGYDPGTDAAQGGLSTSDS